MLFQGSIEERIERLLQLGREHSERFCSAEEQMKRRLYLARHPTLVVVLKCMDGRVHIPWATQMPMGIIRPFRNLGGMFDLGWPYLGEILMNTVQEAMSAGNRTLLLITYHFSRSCHEWGCAGFQYDRSRAFEHALEIQRQAIHLFGRDVVYPVVCGFETDREALIFHGDQDIFDPLQEDVDLQALPDRFRALYPEMPASILRDLLPLVHGNLRHIEITANSEGLQAPEHREWALCIGRGFDFLHAPNVALIVGPYSPDLSGPIAKAGAILADNMRSGRIAADGFLLLASSPYSEQGMDRARAELKSRFLADFAATVLQAEHPELASKMVRRIAVLDWERRSLELID